MAIAPKAKKSKVHIEISDDAQDNAKDEDDEAGGDPLEECNTKSKKFDDFDPEVALEEPRPLSGWSFLDLGIQANTQIMADRESCNDEPWYVHLVG